MECRIWPAGWSCWPPALGGKKQGNSSWESLLGLYSLMCREPICPCYSNSFPKRTGPKSGELLTHRVRKPVFSFRKGCQVLKTCGTSLGLIPCARGITLLHLSHSTFPASGLSPAFSLLPLFSPLVSGAYGSCKLGSCFSISHVAGFFIFCFYCFPVIIGFHFEPFARIV